jgi:hypothetical protein
MNHRIHLTATEKPKTCKTPRSAGNAETPPETLKPITQNHNEQITTSIWTRRKTLKRMTQNVHGTPHHIHLDAPEDAKTYNAKRINPHVQLGAPKNAKTHNAKRINHRLHLGAPENAKAHNAKRINDITAPTCARPPHAAAENAKTANA